ncbi:MAG: hypothetical protein NZ108_06575 [Bacteroidia bacterium]|nr:hypothetical protein [Bacteroidia bacterium]
MVRKPLLRFSTEQQNNFFSLVKDCIKVYVTKEGETQPYRTGAGNYRPLISSGYVEFLMQLYCRSRIKKTDFKADTYFRPKMSKDKRNLFINQLIKKLSARKETISWYYYENFIEDAIDTWTDYQVCEIVQQVLREFECQTISPTHMVNQIHKHVEEPLLRLTELELGISIEPDDLKRYLRLFFNQRKKIWGIF